VICITQLSCRCVFHCLNRWDGCRANTVAKDDCQLLTDVLTLNIMKHKNQYFTWLIILLTITNFNIHMMVWWLLCQDYLASFDNGEEEWKTLWEQLLTVFFFSNSGEVFKERKHEFSPGLELGTPHGLQPHMQLPRHSWERTTSLFKLFKYWTSVYSFQMCLYTNHSLVWGLCVFMFLKDISFLFTKTAFIWSIIQ